MEYPMRDEGGGEDDMSDSEFTSHGAAHFHTDDLSSVVPFPDHMTSPGGSEAGTMNTIMTADPVPFTMDNAQQDQEMTDAAPLTVERTTIWGTNVNIKDIEESFREYILTFPDPNTNEKMYPEVLREILDTEYPGLNLNTEYLYAHDPSLYKHLANYPSEIIPLFEHTLMRVAVELFPEKEEKALDGIRVRPFNLRETRPMRDLDPTVKDIDKLISIRGMIIRTSSCIPELKEAFFLCSACGANETTIVSSDNGGKIIEPTTCNHCKVRGTMSLIHNRCMFKDKQWIKIQESPEAIPEGETPHTVTVYAYDELVDVVKPGDRVEITGVFRASALRNRMEHRTVRSIFKTYVDAVHFRKTEKSRLGSEDAKAPADSEFHTKFNERDEVERVSQEREAKLIELSKSPHIYQLLTRSLAPSIWELDDVKMGILCQLFGGTHKEYKESGLGRFRGEINILLVGDPGTSKSQLLQYVHKLAPRGIYTSGKGSSAVGLTAYITKDADSRETILESGALVLSDRGICCIDEFDKMSDQTRSVLHEVMEQQTVSVAKAGIICTLNARTSILASANPRESKYNPQLSVVDNIQLPPTLLSRFDLIYLVLDKPDERTDRRLAQHLVSLYFKEPEQSRQEVLDIETLTQYISYARQNIHPQISDEAAKDLVAGYVTMRQMGVNKKTITATPRQLESLIRTSEAIARMRFSNVVEKSDVQEALRLVKSALQQAAVDPRTGTIDMDLITTGRSAATRQRIGDIAKAVKEIITSSEQSRWRFDALFKTMKQQTAQGIELLASDVKDALRQLESEDLIMMSEETVNPTIFKKAFVH